MIAAERLLRHRDAVAMLPAIVVLGLLATASVKQIVKLKDTSEAITISLYEEPPEPTPIPPPPQLRAVAPVPRTPAPTEPRAVAVPAPAPVATQLAESAPKPPVPTAAPVAPSPPAAPSALPPARVASEAFESAYVAKLRAYLHSIKRYPTSREARLQRPQGKVRLWLELTRDGTLREAGIDESSGSMILDGAALSTVRQGSYPSFPDDTWAGKGTHRFAVTLEYTLDG